MKGGKKNVQCRIEVDDMERIERLVKISRISESEIIRQCIRTGLTLLEKGDVNPFFTSPVLNESETKYKTPGKK